MHSGGNASSACHRALPRNFGDKMLKHIVADVTIITFGVFNRRQAPKALKARRAVAEHCSLIVAVIGAARRLQQLADTHTNAHIGEYL